MDKLKFDDNGNVILPQPEDIPRQEREQASGSYIMMFAGLYIPLPFIEIVMSIIYYFYYKRKSRFVAFHSYQSLITQLPITFFNTIVTVWLIVGIWHYYKYNNTGMIFKIYFWIFLIFVVLWNLIYIIYSLVASFKANKGRLFYMLLFGRFAYAKYYSQNAVDEYEEIEKKNITNKPPQGF